MRRRNSRRTFIKTVTVGSVIGLSGCQGQNTTGDGSGDGTDDGSSDTSTGTTGGSTGSSEDTVRIGAPVSLSGPYAIIGEDILTSIEVAAEEINNNGGVAGREVEVISRDTQTDPDTGTRVSRELVENENVHMLAGAYSSGVALAIQSVATENQVPAVLTGGSLALTGSECSPYGFNTSGSAYQLLMNGGSYMLDNFGSTVYNITHNYSAGQSFLETTRNVLLPDNDAESLGNSFVDLGQSDMSTQVSQAISSGADILLLHVFAGDLPTAYSQLNEFGAAEEMEILATASDYSAAVAAEPAATAGVHHNMSWWWQLDNPAANSLVERVRERTNRPPGTYGGTKYAGVHTALTVMDEVGDPSDSDAIIDELSGRSWTKQVYGEDFDVKFRACDHRGTLPTTTGLGKPSSERDSEADLLEITELGDPEEINIPCSETGCQM